MRKTTAKIFSPFHLHPPVRRYRAPGFPAYCVLETAALLLLLGADILSPFFYKEFIDRVLLNGEMDRLFPICALMLGLFAARYAVRLIKLKTEMKYEFSVQAEIRGRLFDSYAGYSVPDREGEYLKLYDEYARKLSEGFRKYRMEPLSCALTVLVLGIISICIDLQLFLISILAIAASFTINHICAERIHGNSEGYRRVKAENDSWILSLLQNLSGIRGLGRADELTDRYGRLEEAVFSSYARERKILCGVSVLQDFNYRFLLEMVLYFYGGYLILNDRLLLGTFMAFLSYYKKIYRNVKLLGDRRVACKKEAPWFESVTEAAEKAAEPEAKKTPGKMESIHEAVGEELHICGDYYPYGKEENIFHLSVEDVRIKKGSRIAVVGESGCGKTSFAKLICGLYERCGCFYVEKEPYFFDLSVMDNLLLVDEDREKAKRYLRLCFSPEEIEELKMLRADKKIGEGGCRLSGGQRERLNMVRVLLKSPSLIVWDEATAQMDAEVEKKMYEMIRAELPESTHIFISHKKEVLAYVDEVICAENGRVRMGGSCR